MTNYNNIHRLQQQRRDTLSASLSGFRDSQQRYIQMRSVVRNFFNQHSDRSSHFLNDMLLERHIEEARQSIIRDHQHRAYRSGEHQPIQSPTTNVSLSQNASRVFSLIDPIEHDKIQNSGIIPLIRNDFDTICRVTAGNFTIPRGSENIQMSNPKMCLDEALKGILEKIDIIHTLTLLDDDTINSISNNPPDNLSQLVSQIIKSGSSLDKFVNQVKKSSLDIPYLIENLSSIK